VPFALSVVVKNQGQKDAGTFAVATSFEPGAVYAGTNIAGLPAGQQTTVTLNATVNGTGIYTIAIVLDLNSQLDEGSNGEGNNKPQYSYKIDRVITSQGSISLNAGNTVSFTGSPPADVSWDGAQLSPLGTAKIGLLSGLQFGQLHYDLLTPDKVSSAAIPAGSLPPGTLVEIYTASGRRGILKISGISGTTITLDYFIYG